MGGNGGGVAPARCLEWCAGATHIGWAYRSAAGSLGPRPTRRLSVGAMTTTTPLAAPQSFYVMQDLVTLHARYRADRLRIFRHGGRGGARGRAAAAAHPFGM